MTAELTFEKYHQRDNTDEPVVGHHSDMKFLNPFMGDFEKTVIKDGWSTPDGKGATHCNALQLAATHCNALQRAATRCNALRRTATHCNTLQHTATHYNTLQHSARNCY